MSRTSLISHCDTSNQYGISIKLNTEVCRLILEDMIPPEVWKIIPVTINLYRFTRTEDDSIISQSEFNYLEYLNKEHLYGMRLVSSLLVFDMGFNLKMEKPDSKVLSLLSSKDENSKKLGVSLLSQYSTFLNRDLYYQYNITSSNTLWAAMVKPWL